MAKAVALLLSVSSRTRYQAPVTSYALRVTSHPRGSSDRAACSGSGGSGRNRFAEVNRFVKQSLADNDPVQPGKAGQLSHILHVGNATTGNDLATEVFE